MLPVGLLMIEHRRIERFVALLEPKAWQEDLELSTAITDFFRTYADRTHHGKEEDILFRALADKHLSSEHRRILDELAQEHVQARALIASLVSATRVCLPGGASTPETVEIVRQIARFYPPHIEKEDKHFFIPVMGYFSEDERARMIEQFYEYDRRMIHDKYEEAVVSWERQGE